MDNKIVWAYYGHEPSYHLKRMHNAPSTFCLGEWSDAWQDKMRTEESVKRLKSLGVNLIYTNFFKGFGLKFEKEEIEKTKNLVEICHKYDIKVLGYLQLGSIYYETFLSETKSSYKMSAKKRDGSYQLWAGSYYRWDTCYNSKEFKAYIKKVINYGLDKTLLDGFHFDNSFIAVCYCKRCKKDFRKWLKNNVDNPKEVMGIGDFSHVEFPPYSEANPVKNYDALFYLWQEYRQSKLSKFHNEIFKYAKEKSCNKAIIAHNPAFPRDSRAYIRHGYNPELSSKYCDFVFAENHDVLVNKDGFLTTQILSYKLASAFNYNVLETSWLYDEKGQSIYPRTYFEIAYCLSSSMVFGNVVGSTWIMRSTHQNDKMLLDDKLQYQTHQKVISYYLNNHDLYGGKAVNNVKILYYNPNMINRVDDGIDKFKRVVNLLNNNFINFSIISQNDLDNLSSSDILVVPYVYYTSDDLLSKIKRVSGVIKTVIFGDFNVCNLYGRARDKFDAKNVFDNAFYVDSESELVSYIKNNLEKAITSNLENVVLEVKEDRDNLYLHLLSTAERVPSKLVLTFKGYETLKGVKVYSYDDIKYSHSDRCIEIDNFVTMATVKIPK
ncbi:MAG: beta-galactosidase [Clostridia bacterium]|nr:beta-galactosidase [Clostridia bacterium]